MDAIPEVPAEFALSGATSTSIDLSWVDNSSNESGFEIERSLTSSDEDFSNIHTVPAGTTTYTDMGLDSDIEYFYRIRAVNSTGASLYTSVESTTTLPAPPAAPTGLSATAIDENTIDLSWTDTNNENNYIIERSFTSGSGFTVIDTISANSTSYRDGTLTEDTRYYYRIYATNPGGDSDYSNEASAITDPSVPDAPSNMTFTDVKETSMRVRWEDNSDNEDNFVLERRESASDSWGVIAEPTNNYYDDSGLEDNTTYYYQVKAVNAAGFSDYTSGSQTTLLAKPAAPFDFEGIANNTCTVDLTWQDTAHNEDGFELWKRIGSTGTYELLETLPPDTQSYIDTDTENETTYGYRIHAFNDAGTSEYAFTTVNVNVVLDGGTIGYDQTICPEGDAELIQNVDSPSGGSGNWIYQWQSRTTGDFSDITGAEGISYDPPAGMTETTDYQRVSTTECGSVTSNSVTITVEDLEDPVFDLCPDDIVLEVERDQTTGEVDTPDPVATDNCGIELLTWSMTGATVASSPETGFNTVGLYTFNLGVTTVTYHVEDQSGNEAECSFTVTVEIKDPEVLDVTIPNNIMGIGQRVTVTITVAEDGGSEYDLISGTIGGYTLEDLTRENSTTYYTSFDIYEGGNSYPADQDIPVTNLVVTDGKEQSDPYNLPIVQPNDLLDAERPVIESMSVETGQKKIDDVVELNIDADGPDYTIDPASVINGISVDEPNMEFTDLDGGNYRLSYRVQEGDQDVGPGELTASIILVKPSGNVNEPYTLIGNVNNLTIDAHAPVVTRMEVPDEEVGVGGEVQVTVTADGSGYAADAGTTVNGIPLSSSAVTFSEQPGGLYLLSYIVSQGDDNVAPGTLNVSLVLRDPAGNTGSAYKNVESNTLEVYTELPEALLVPGSPDICEGDAVEMEVFLSGRSPWSIQLDNGTTIVEYSDITDSTFEFNVTPEQTTTYSIPLVTDRNGVVNTGSGGGQVTVNEKTDVEFINLATGYSVEADPFPLEANVMGGDFSGPGVISSTGYFDPGLAD
ncbi:MAG: fibronectin type III domain-containing protein, partial [Bacteroidales bacterium]